MSEKITKKQSDTEFVCKLCDMIDKYPQIINWNEEGDKMIIFDIDQMQGLVLPQYFRHSNFPSFIRQLNMYDFHKLYKENKLIAFENQYFKRDNQPNFHFIQRRKKIKQQQLVSLQFQRKNQSLLRRLKKQPKITSTIKQSIHSLLEYKYTAHENTKTIKQELETLHTQLKQCRSKKINQALKEIKSNIDENLGQQLQLSREIDHYLETNFLRKKETMTEMDNQQQHLQINSQYYLPFIHQDNKQYNKNLIDYQNMASNRFIALNSHYSYWSANDLHLPCIHPIFFSNHKITPESDFLTLNRMKQESQQQEEDEGFSMEIIPEAQVGEILNPQQNEKQKPMQTDNKNQDGILKQKAE